MGTHVQQAGSFVGPDYFRFDFSHFQALSPEQLSAIQRLTQEAILANKPVSTYEVPFHEKPKDCLSFFADTYGALVRVVQIGDESKELCGGTHVQSTGELGMIHIISESAIAAGVRRIEAKSGFGAFEAIQTQAQQLQTLAQKLNGPVEELEKRLSLVLEQKLRLEKEFHTYQQKELSRLALSLEQAAVPHQGLSWVVSATPSLGADQLRNLASTVSKGLGASVVFLASPQGEKLSVLALCSKEALALGRNAGQLVQTFVQPLAGKGGGKADFAFGSCPLPDKLEPVLEGFKHHLLAEK